MEILSHRVMDHDCLSIASEQIYILEQFRDEVVQPSLDNINLQLAKLKTDTTDLSIFLFDDFDALRNITIQGFLISLQSLWERGFRSMLKAFGDKANNSVISRNSKVAKWSTDENGLQTLFATVIGIEIRLFPSYKDLSFLQMLANAIRHGDGRSASQLYQLCPSLWPKEHGAVELTNFSDIVIPSIVLEQMFKSVIEFWIDIDLLRCNSFSQKAPIVESKLQNWRSEIEKRIGERVWNMS